VEESLAALFEWRNVPDDLQAAYAAAFTGSNVSISEHYAEVIERGDQALIGFVSNLKGKLAEIRIVPALESEFPGYQFALAEHPNQPLWDIEGIGPEGSEAIFVQVKTGGESYAGAVMNRMQDSPDLFFVLSTEIREKILSQYPELARQVLEIEYSGLEMTEEVQEGLALLAAHLGVDVPDTIGDWLPYVDELVLGVLLLVNYQGVQRDFAQIGMSERKRVHALKSLFLLSRFAVSGAAVGMGGAIGGAAIPGVGVVPGAIIGAGVAHITNRKLKHQVLAVAMRVVDLDEEDLFYFKNKVRIDTLALSMKELA
jgi:hypothetical protein